MEAQAAQILEREAAAAQVVEQGDVRRERAGLTLRCYPVTRAVLELLGVEVLLAAFAQGSGLEEFET